MTTDARHLDLEQLSALIDDRLELEARATAEAHLASCTVCQQDLADLRATLGMLRTLPVLQPPRSFRLPEPRPARSSGRRPLALWLRAASGLAAAVFVLLLMGDLLAPSTGPRSAPPAATPAAAPRAAPALRAAPAAPEGGQPAGQQSNQPAASATPASAATPQPDISRDTGRPSPAIFSLRGGQALAAALAIGLFVASLLLTRPGRPPGPA